VNAEATTSNVTGWMRYLLLPVPAEGMTRSIRWSVDWQRAGRVTQDRVILSRQLVG
jgi:hypothetical protein